jgi:hypothetical protein
MQLKTELKSNNMKCVKVIKATPNNALGTILRLENKEADKRVDKGIFTYVSKSEYKAFKNSK